MWVGTQCPGTVRRAALAKMVKHNNVVPNGHFHKKWQRRVRTWFDQVSSSPVNCCKQGQELRVWTKSKQIEILA